MTDSEMVISSLALLAAVAVLFWCLHCVELLIEGKLKLQREGGLFLFFHVLLGLLLVLWGI